MRPVRTWSIITPEYPPQSGGIGDYTELVARRLAARGDRVSVYTRSPPGRLATADVEVVLLPDDFGRATQQLLAAAFRNVEPDAVVLLQYVPQGLRRRGMNVPFCAWLGARPERRFLMLHEALYSVARQHTFPHWFLAGATRAMLHLLARHAERVFVSTPAWEHFVERWGKPSRPVEWLPIPATLAADPEGLLPTTHAPETSVQKVVSHFGTYGLSITPLLEPLLLGVLRRREDVAVRLLGRGAEHWARRLAATEPKVGARIVACAGSAEEIAEELARAGAVLLPFIEGVTSRRTSVMNALAVGAAIVTTNGGYTERIWRTSGAVSLYPFDRPELAQSAIDRLLDDPVARAAQRHAALALYRERFHLERVIDRLQAAYDANATAREVASALTLD
jgi:glycosyltransferase involved in cell wall biosynthesis